MKKYIIWLCLLIVSVTVIWLSSGKSKSNTIKIGAALGQTGICAEFGEGELKAVTLAVEEINKLGGVNGKQINLIAEDTQCENKTTVSAFQKLINIDKVAAIIGPTWGDSFQGGYPIAYEKKIVSVSPSTAIEALEITKQPIDFIFSTWFPARLETDALQKFALKKGLKKIVIVHDQDPFGIMSAMVFKERSALNGLEITDEYTTAVDTSDFRTIISRIKAKSPDAIFSSFITPESKAIFIKQARQLGIRNPILSTAEIQNPSLLSGFGDVLEGVIYTYPKGAKGFDDFAIKYKERFGVEPQGPSASNAYDAVHILVEAMRQGGDFENKLLTASIGGATYDTLKFSSQHQVSDGAFEIKTIKGKQFIRVE